jgi:hypothetical protein
MEKNSVNILGATATTFTIPTATLATAGTYDVLISGPSGYTLLDTICSSNINNQPKTNGSATAQTICSGSTTNVVLNSTLAVQHLDCSIQTTPTGTITGFSDTSSELQLPRL